MAVDPYSPCPGGTSKNIKFCCPDLMADLDKIRRMLEGEQRLACLEYVNKVHASHGDRACLLAVKSMLEVQLGNEEAAESTLSTFVLKYPDNPVALAERSMLEASQGNTLGGLESLVRAIEASGQSMPARVYEAMTPLASMLLADGEVLPARALLMVQAEIAGPDDQRPLQLLMRVLNSPQVPLLLKEDPVWQRAPEGAAWRGEFDQALGLALRGAWRGAANRFRALLNQAGDHVAIWKNLSVLYGWLADKSAATEALRKYSSMAEQLDDAVEAEALAQLLGEDAIGPDIDVLTVVFSVGDTTAIESRLSSNRTARLEVDLSQAVPEGEPPPRAAYWLLDKPLPTTGVGITIDAVPSVLATLYVFGKQTDREARVEMVVTRSELQAAEEALRQVAGDALGAKVEERVTTAISATSHTLGWNWRLPDDTPLEHRKALMEQKRHEVMFQRWMHTSMRLLDSKTPRDAAADPSHRTKLLASILLMELTDTDEHLDSDYNEVRRQLNLPENGAIDPDGVDTSTLPLVRLSRLIMQKLSDDALVQVYQRASLVRAELALRKAATEILARPSLDSKVDKAETYGILSRIEPDPNKAVSHIHEARKLTERTGKSCARWDLEELSLQLQLGSAPDLQRLVEHIRDKHMREPGVAQALVGMLSQAGLIRPDGAPMPAAEQPASSIVVPGGAASAGKLWTPDSAQPAGQKQGIWTPD